MRSSIRLLKWGHTPREAIPSSRITSMGCVMNVMTSDSLSRFILTHSPNNLKTDMTDSQHQAPPFSLWCFESFPIFNNLLLLAKSNDWIWESSTQQLRTSPVLKAPTIHEHKATSFVEAIIHEKSSRINGEKIWWLRKHKEDGEHFN